MNTDAQDPARALVVGGGISGLAAGLGLADLGFSVTLVERSDHLGGLLSLLDYQFPNDRCGMCRLLPMVGRDDCGETCLRRGLFHERIDVRLATEVMAVAEEGGRFRVSLQHQSGLVDPDRCMGCGRCSEVCPVEVPDGFNAGLSLRKAIYRPVPHAAGQPFVIDGEACSRCGACVTACPSGAVRLEEYGRAGFHVLVVDDEPIVRNSLKEWLTLEGFSAETAASGHEALAKLSERDFHLMLLDIKMPDMDGVEVLENARSPYPGLEVVMMTAYATVETAIAAMKIGALDYLVKPFDPEAMVSKVVDRFFTFIRSRMETVAADALILCGGTDFHTPSADRWGYGRLPHVVTALEFERLLSRTGPGRGRLARPGDGREVGSIAWIQCVGSRDLQAGADYCCAVGCMHALKEAVLVRKSTGRQVETSIFHLDMRTFGKSFERYRQDAEKEHGVRFCRGMVHSLAADPAADRVRLRHVSPAGEVGEKSFDLVVLAAGQRPAAGLAALAEAAGLPLDGFGFGRPEPFSMIQTPRPGIFWGGGFTGIKDIGDSVIHGLAAAGAAAEFMGLSRSGRREPPPAVSRALDREPARTLALVCTCGGALKESLDLEALKNTLTADFRVAAVEVAERWCDGQDTDALAAAVNDRGANRLLFCGCQARGARTAFLEAGRRADIPALFTEIVDWWSPLTRHRGFEEKPGWQDDFAAHVRRISKMALVSLHERETIAAAGKPVVVPRALVVGGGIAGLTAALAIAECGLEVVLVEMAAELGGNLSWIGWTIGGDAVPPFLESVLIKVSGHPRIRIHTRTRVRDAVGWAGDFTTLLEGDEGEPWTVHHGVTVLATGGREARPDSYGYGKSPLILTQRELTRGLAKGEIDPAGLSAVVMIQCVESREPPRNYCSRVCCLSALKNALELKARHPEMGVFVLYRDLMTPGLAETWYTEARRQGVQFISYDVARKPEVTWEDEGVTVTIKDPLSGKFLAIEADRLVLSSGVVPQLPAELAAIFGAEKDPDGFFREADSKWRPVEGIRPGLFACGLAHSPRSIPETVTMARACAQRAVRFLRHGEGAASEKTAQVRQSLCRRCLQCIDACPYQARRLDTQTREIRINPALCQGCGICQSVCPNNAAVLPGFEDRWMLGAIDAALA